MSNCPICSGNILRHIKGNRVYWYCHHCYQEVPNFAKFPCLKEYDRAFYELIGSRKLMAER